MVRTLGKIEKMPRSDREVLGLIKGAVTAVLPEAKVFAYGSAARGARKVESDFDILVLTDSKVRRSDENAIEDALYELELTREVPISTMILSEDEWDSPIIRVSPFRKEVERDAVLI